MATYYNEFKPEASYMLRQLIRDGLIAPGDVDNRPIQEVRPDDLKGYTQCHFFAGIGGWSVALRLAMWGDDRPVWTGSCPCQPFSSAGKQKGKADERHLWPVWAKLVRECRPATVFGEQVASAVAHGWWDDVADDLEAEGYAVGAAVLPACSIGKPHKRDRLWFVANSESERSGRASGSGRGEIRRPSTDYCNQFGGTGSCSNVANAECARPQGHGRHEQQHDAQGRQEPDGYAGEIDLQWLACPDGKQRPVEPSICLLAHGVQHRASLLHGYGNAIVPQVAAEFIKATKE